VSIIIVMVEDWLFSFARARKEQRRGETREGERLGLWGWWLMGLSRALCARSDDEWELLLMLVLLMLCVGRAGLWKRARFGASGGEELPRRDAPLPEGGGGGEADEERDARERLEHYGSIDS
jgi:hypothetical protein